MFVVEAITVTLKMNFGNVMEDQCGAPNALVQLSTHLIQDRGLKEQGLTHPFQHENFPNENEQVKNPLNLFYRLI